MRKLMAMWPAQECLELSRKHIKGSQPGPNSNKIFKTAPLNNGLFILLLRAAEVGLTDAVVTSAGF